MHVTAFEHGQHFFNTYSEYFNNNYFIVELGSMNLNGSLREISPTTQYIGLDMCPGNGVDIVLEDPYVLPFADNSVDVLVSSSCFEHTELFWKSYLECLRVLKPNGLFYMNVPTTGWIHKCPVDCWRFWPDAGRALITWAKRNNMSPCLLESYMDERLDYLDFVAVFCKSAEYKDLYPKRICDSIPTPIMEIRKDIF